ncbi:MAG: DUF2808 domain-containing protein [Cyanobacteria bacterium P01_A01_bin.3]
MTLRSHLALAAAKAAPNATLSSLTVSSLAVAGLTFSSLVLGGTALSSLWVNRSYAVTFSDGRIAFNSPPLMVDHSLTPSNAGARNATYRFAISVPDNAGESLSYVEILPFSGTDAVDFRLNAISAYAGDGIRRGDPIPVIGRSLDDDPSETRASAVRVQFDPPLLPGQTATIVLKSLRNPSFSRSFTYEAIAYPDLVAGVGHRMGLARFTIHSNGGCDRLRC